MLTSELLHVAFRARDSLALSEWYAELFEGEFLLHPVMSALDIVMVKLNHPEAVFHGMLEFWPWDIVWDGAAAAFRRIEPRPSPTSYGHVALKVSLTADSIMTELRRRGIPMRLEPRGPGFLIPVIDDPEGNMIELFPNIAHMELPPGALCPRGQARKALAALKAGLQAKVGSLQVGEAVSLLLPGA